MADTLVVISGDVGSRVLTEELLVFGALARKLRSALREGVAGRCEGGQIRRQRVQVAADSLQLSASGLQPLCRCYECSVVRLCCFLCA